MFVCYAHLLTNVFTLFIFKHFQVLIINSYWQFIVTRKYAYLNCKHSNVTFCARVMEYIQRKAKTLVMCISNNTQQILC